VIRSIHRWVLRTVPAGARAAGRFVAAVALALLIAEPCCGTQPRAHDDVRIVIHKNDQILELHRNGSPVKSYRVCLGLDPQGPKRITGDRKTPEGEYFICYKSAESSFCRFLGISYPGEHDAQAAFESGLISLDSRDSIISRVRQRLAPPWNTKLGGWVGIHGYPTDPYQRRWISLLYPKPHNWTDGCIALWNFEIEDLFDQVTVGTPVSIEP